MNTDLEDAGRRAVACRGWVWLLGCPWVRPPTGAPDDGGDRGVCDGDAPPDGALPNLAEPAAEGCLLALVRQASGDPDAYVARVTSIAAWVVFVRGQEPVESYDGRVDALVCAWERMNGRVSLRRRGGSR